MADDPVGDLERLAKLLDEGKITPEEYERLKANSSYQTPPRQHRPNLRVGTTIQETQLSRPTGMARSGPAKGEAATPTKR